MDTTSHTDESRIHNADDALASLERTSSQLRQLALYIPLLTFVHLISLPLSFLIQTSSRYPDQSPHVEQTLRNVFLLLDNILFFSCLALLMIFERLSKRGDALMQEISDELEWRPLNPETSASDSPQPKFPSPRRVTSRPAMRWRLAFREFALASRLPFSNSRSSTAVYLIINIFLFIVISGWQMYFLTQR